MDSFRPGFGAGCSGVTGLCIFSLKYGPAGVVGDIPVELGGYVRVGGTLTTKEMGQEIERRIRG